MEAITNVPATRQTNFDDATARSNYDFINKNITAKFGKVITPISKMTNVPVAIIESFIFLYSKGDYTLQSAAGIGLMKISPENAWEVLVREKKAARMSAPEEDLVSKYLGAERYKKFYQITHESRVNEVLITKQDLLYPEFNILLGTMLIKQLIDKLTEKDGRVRLDKVAVLYNIGTSTSVAKAVIAFEGNTDNLLKSMPSLSSTILNFVGKNGVLDSLQTNYKV